MQYYNVHTHIFTMNNAPKDLLQLYLPRPVAKIIDRMTDTQLGAASIGWLLSKLGGHGGKRYASFLEIGKSKNQQEVFTRLMNQYKDDHTIKFIALTMNMENSGAGPSSSGFEGQLEEILEVKRQFPHRLLIFLGIDPRWKASGRQLRDTVNLYFNKKMNVTASQSVFPFAGLKLYPSMGYYPFDERLKETFEWAAKHKVPVLSHCNYLGGMFNNDEDYLAGNLVTLDPYSGKQYPATPITYLRQRNFRRWILGRDGAFHNLNKCSYFLEPASYDSLLNYFQQKGTPLKLCLAHYGGGEQMLNSGNVNATAPFGTAGNNWFDQINTMMKKYKQLYTDISYALHDKDTYPIIFRELDNTAYGNRIMFGTDYFMTEREIPEKDDYRNFKAASSEKILNDGTRAWDRIASKNVSAFLQSDFYTG